MNNTSINHIFIFCDNHDDVAQELINFGFTEGVGRIHPDQGTKNRKFYFENFYLEILWVYNEDEVNNDITAPTKLYERSKYASNGSSPFGLCLNYNTNDNTLFQNTLIYKPTYLPADMHIDVLTNNDAPSLPWTFRWKVDRFMGINSEYVTHKNNIKNLTKAIFSCLKNEQTKAYTKHFKDNENVDFINSRELSLTLLFDEGKCKRKKIFDTVSLVIEY